MTSMRMTLCTRIAHAQPTATVTLCTHLLHVEPTAWTHRHPRASRTAISPPAVNHHTAPLHHITPVACFPVAFRRVPRRRRWDRPQDNELGWLRESRERGRRKVLDVCSGNGQPLHAWFVDDKLTGQFVVGEALSIGTRVLALHRRAHSSLQAQQCSHSQSTSRACKNVIHHKRAEKSLAAC